VGKIGRAYIMNGNWGGGGEANELRVLMGKPKGKIPLGRPRRGWENNIRINLREVECGSVGWIKLAQDRISGRLS
jgi:hypothetical protein